MTQKRLEMMFYLAAENARTPADVVEAIASLPADAVDSVSDAIVTLCASKGIDPQSAELLSYYQSTSAYKAEQERNAKLETALADMKGIIDAVDKAKAEGKTPTQKDIDDIRQRIHQTSKHLIPADASADASKSKEVFITFDQYIGGRAQREYWTEFSPKLFAGTTFPNGTISVIGAAPGKGKSASLVNLCRELLTTAPSNNPHLGHLEKAQDSNAVRKILFISNEMTSEDITDRLIHAVAWQIGREDTSCGLESVEHTNIDYWNALKALYGHAPEYWTFTAQEKKRHQLYQRVIEEYIKPAWGVRIETAYTRGLKTFDDIADIIKTKAEKGTLVLMDYLQLLPPMRQDAIGNVPRYLAIRNVMDSAILAAEQTQSVIICAAQLGREERKGENAKDDTQGWRESGDIEQSAWNAIKLFMETDDDKNAVLTYKVVKARSGKAGDGKILQWIPEYQFMENTEKTPPKKIKKKSQSDQDSNGVIIHEGFI